MTFALVVSSITHDGNNQLLNTNADTIAQEIAKAMSTIFGVAWYIVLKNRVCLKMWKMKIQ